MGISKDRNLNIDNLELAKLPDGTLLQLRTDSSTPGRTIYGYSAPGTAQTASDWFIYAEDVVGTSSQRHFAHTPTFPGTETADFIHQWSNRNNLLPGVAFENTFSIQLAGAANSWGSVADSPDIDFANTDAFSIGIWHKTTNGASELYQKTSTNAGNNGYWLRMDSSDRYEFSFRGAGTGDRIRVRTDSFTSAGDGNWNFVMVTKAAGSTAASTIKIYTGNGGTLTDETLNVLNDTLTGTTTNSSVLAMGANMTGGGARYQGNMDEFAIWNVELTSAEVAEIYNSNNGCIDLQSASGQISSALVSWWRFGDGSFTAIPTIPDEQGSNNMTMQSAVTSGDIETEVPP